MDKQLKKNILAYVNITLIKYNKKIRWCRIKQIQNYAYGSRFVIKSYFPFGKLLLYVDDTTKDNKIFKGTLYLVKGYKRIKLEEGI